jgi:hypothetical protein
VAVARRPAPGALIVSMKQNSPPLADGGMRTKRSSPMAGILIGASAPRECRKEMFIATTFRLNLLF